jgi:hypothetical protein
MIWIMTGETIWLYCNTCQKATRHMPQATEHNPVPLCLVCSMCDSDSNEPFCEKCHALTHEPCNCLSIGDRKR